MLNPIDCDPTPIMGFPPFTTLFILIMLFMQMNQKSFDSQAFKSILSHLGNVAIVLFINIMEIYTKIINRNNSVIQVT